MKVISVKKLVLEARTSELKRHITRMSPLIEDYIVVEECFSDAAKYLGFKRDTIPDSKYYIKLILNPDEYKCIDVMPEFTQVILNNIRHHRDDIIKRVNDDLISNAHKLIPDEPDKLSENYHMLDISKILLSTLNVSYLRYINGSVKVDEVKYDFDWLIRELEDAGYHAKLIVFPAELRIQVSLPAKHVPAGLS